MQGQLLQGKRSIAAAFLLMGVGVLVPPSVWVDLTRPEAVVSVRLSQQLLLGATLFRIGLIVTGLMVLVLSRLPLWDAAKRQRPKAASFRPRPAHLVLLAVLLLVALVLRLYRLGEGLWHDEVVTLLEYGRLSFGEILSTYKDQNNHILYTLLARASMLTFGESAWALRLPAVLFGVASIGALYLFARQVGRPKEALFSVAVLTFSYHHIWFSQNARGYIGLLFWTLLSSYFLVRGLRGGRPRNWLYYALSAALGVLTHLTMIFVVAGQALVYLIERFVRRRDAVPLGWAGFFLGFGLAGWLTLLLHAFVLPQIFYEFFSGHGEFMLAAWQNPLWTVLEFVRAFQMGVAGSVVLLIGALVLGVGMWSWGRDDSIVLQLFFLPVLICTAATLAIGHNFFPRLFFFAAGFGVLIVVRGLLVLGETVAERLPFAARQSAWGGTALAMAFVLLSAASVPFVYGPKQDYQGALAYVEAHRAPGDTVVATGMASYTYRGLLGADLPDVRTAAAVEAAQSGARRTWLLYCFPPHVQEKYPDVLARIERDFTVVERFAGTLGGGTVFVCLSETPPAATRASTSR